MNRYGILALTLALCCTLFTGCRRGNNNMGTVSPTNEATAEMPTMPTVMPDTRPATEPTVTEPAVTEPTQRETADATEDTTGASEATDGNRSRTGPNRPAAR